MLGQTKTREGRDIPITCDLKRELEIQVNGMAQDGWLFAGASGYALNYGYFRRAHFGPAVERLGLTDVTIHTLRHTCASPLIALQAPIMTASQILHHASVKMTLDTYGYFYKDETAV